MIPAWEARLHGRTGGIFGVALPGVGKRKWGGGVVPFPRLVARGVLGCCRTGCHGALIFVPRDTATVRCRG